jgi:hypothetical protein
MTLEEELIPFADWFPTALGHWAVVVAVLVGATFLVGWILAIAQSGPVRGTERVFLLIPSLLNDLIHTSPRRVMALARLAIHESLHRRVLVTFGLFVVVLLFATWFLDTDSPDLTKRYLSFVTTWTTYLVLLLALFLSVFSLPVDITSRTIHTIVTKPVRRQEIVLGRVLGFGIVGTILLLVTGGISYGFVLRGLSHRHTVDLESLKAEEGSSIKRGRSSPEHNHRHEVQLDPDGKLIVEPTEGHWHEANADGTELGPPEGYLQARIPKYGKMRFLDDQGNPGPGVSVGKEWTYRKYIRGGTLAAAIWTFDDVTPAMLNEMGQLPIELTLSVYRTRKGDINRRVLGTIQLINPDTQRSSKPITFESHEFNSQLLLLDKAQRNQRDQKIDLFEDLVSDGRIEVMVRCLEHSQYFGMAQADVYIRSGEGSFAVNFIKAYVGIWLQMILVIGLGVAFSTFLNSAVSMLATMAAILGGFFLQFVSQMAQGGVEGGGPLESVYRIIANQNLTSELESGSGTDAIKLVDEVFQYLFRFASALLPDFSSLSGEAFLINGYDIAIDQVAINVVSTLAYLIPVCLFGYLFLKIREIAR